METRALAGDSRAFATYTSAYAKVRLVEDFEGDPLPAALVIGVAGPYSADAELNDEVHRLRIPITYTDSQFGAITLNRANETFEGAFDWRSQRAQLIVLRDDIDGLAPALGTARELWLDQELWHDRLLDCISENAFEIASAAGRSESGALLSSEQFEAQLRVRTILARPSGMFQFVLEAGGVFEGSRIYVTGTLSDGLDIPRIGNLNGPY